jgi:hypothetical protein
LRFAGNEKAAYAAYQRRLLEVQMDATHHVERTWLAAEEFDRVDCVCISGIGRQIHPQRTGRRS